MGIGTSPTNSLWTLSLGCALILFWMLTDTPMPFFQPSLAATQNSLFIINRVAGAIGLIFLSISLFGLYDKYLSSFPNLSIPGFLLSMISISILAGSLYQQTIAQPIHESVVNNSVSTTMVIIWASAFSIGYALFSISILLSNNSQKLAAILILIGAPLFAIFGSMQVGPQIVAIVGCGMWIAGHLLLVFKK